MRHETPGAPYGSSLVDVVVDITAAYVAANTVQASALPDLIVALHNTLARLSSQGSASARKTSETTTPPRSKIVSKDSICCLECGRRFSSLVRHLSEAHKLTADAYRLKWQLPGGFPMISPALTQIRSQNAKTMGLGKRSKAAAKR